MAIVIVPIKALIGGIVRVDKGQLIDHAIVETIRLRLEDRGALVFPQIGMNDQD